MQNKSKKLTSRLLSALLALACVLTLLPGVAVAAEDEGGKMVVDKTAKLEDDGTYTIELSAYATGTTTTTTTQKAVHVISSWCWISLDQWARRLVGEPLD